MLKKNVVFDVVVCLAETSPVTESQSLMHLFLAQFYFKSDPRLLFGVSVLSVSGLIFFLTMGKDLSLKPRVKNIIDPTLN